MGSRKKKLVLDARDKEERELEEQNEASERVIEERRNLVGKTPIVEWWDKPFLKARKDVNGEDIFSYGATIDPVPTYTAMIDNRIIHPIPIQPPAEILPDGSIPLPLTKQEQRRITKQNKLAARIRVNEEQLLGMREAPKDRVRLTNMYRVYGTDAMMDPTRIELLVRKETAERVERHEERNQERKLTSEQKKEKNMKKLTADTNVIVNVCVFKATELTTKNRFKVDKNAQQFFLTGTCVIIPSFCLIIVEGGVLALRKYKKLMLRRIKWGNKKPENDDDESDEQSEEDNDAEVTPEKDGRCDLVWEGEVMTRSFYDFQVKSSRTEGAAKKYLSDRGVVHYFEMARTFVPGK